MRVCVRITENLKEGNCRPGCVFGPIHLPVFANVSSKDVSKYESNVSYN